MKRTAFLITNITEFGKLMAYCIENDIRVWRVYWDERKAGDRCYCISWDSKQCTYCDKNYFKEKSYDIVEPEFYVDEYGKYRIKVGNRNAGMD